ncbi:hypothetical protein ScPMuIL_007538 [Solemya velum]
MPAFGFNVTVGGKVLKEYEHNGQFYIEANLHTPASYKISECIDGYYSQESPVTPYCINIWKERTDCPCFMYVYVDGERIYGRPCQENRTQFTVSGYRSGGAVNELLFTLPKMTEEKVWGALSENQKQQLGSISIEYFAAIARGTSFAPKKNFRAHVDTVLSKDAEYTRASKNCMSKATDVLISTMIGRSMGYLEDSGQMVRRTNYIRREKIGEVHLYYRPRHILQEFGIEDEDWKVPKLPETTVEKTAVEESSVEVKAEQLSMYETTCTPIGKGKLGIYTPTSNKLSVYTPSEREKKSFNFSEKLNTEKMNCYTPSAVKTEKSDDQQDMFDSDDELDCIIEADNSIIFMGDQSCCIFEPEEEEAMCIDLL